MKTVMRRLSLGMTVAALLTVGAALTNAKLAQASTPAQTGWVTLDMDHQLSFAYPKNFVSANDGGPYVSLMGGALQSADHTAYELLLGVAIDRHPQISVAVAREQLLYRYRADKLLADRPTAFGRELSFAMPGKMTYTLYLAPIRAGVREIIINNEQSNPSYLPLITRFLHTVHNA